MRTPHMNLMDVCVDESELIEDVEWLVRNMLRPHEEPKKKTEEVEAEECTCENDDDEDDNDKGKDEDGG